MNQYSDISDDEFVPFLSRLGVETYKKSFEWMLSDPDFAGVLRWLYNSLDQTNALTAREEYRYAEIQKKDKLLPSDHLESAILALQAECPGLVLPGNQDAMEDLQLDIGFQRERLRTLEQHEEMIEELIKQNEKAKENLICQEAKLHATQKQCQEDEKSASQDCVSLAQEIEDITEGVIDVIADTLDVHSNCHLDKAIAEKFITFGPFESYRQSQALFQSHFNLYTSSKFGTRQLESGYSEAEVLTEANSMENSLSDAVTAYICTKADLSGVQAKLSLVSNYEDVHPSQIALASMEAQSAIELLNQEESILEQQISGLVTQLVRSRTSEVTRVAVSAALAVREHTLASLSWLRSVCARALACDLLLYHCARSERRAAQALLQFAADLRAHRDDDRAARRSRIESMNAITAEHQQVSEQLQIEDPLLPTLHVILETEGAGAVALARGAGALRGAGREARGRRAGAVKGREENLEDFKRAYAPLVSYLWDGCTKQPNCHERAVAALTHALKRDMDTTERRVLEASGMFTKVKNGDKNHLRRLWQWFLTDQQKLLAVMKETQSKSYS